MRRWRGNLLGKTADEDDEDADGEEPNSDGYDEVVEVEEEHANADEDEASNDVGAAGVVGHDEMGSGFEVFTEEERRGLGFEVGEKAVDV